MEEAILNFPKQFEFKPEVVNAEKLLAGNSLVIGGMGGSHLAADILAMLAPGLVRKIHMDYWSEDLAGDALKDCLFVASSYSGNTEETIDFAKKALASGRKVAVMATGGKLLELAKEKGLPYVEIPKTGIQPRSALGYGIMALAKISGRVELVTELARLNETLDSSAQKVAGAELAQKLFGKVPVIYSSLKNQPIAYNWKIKFNETGKMPAFYNVFPELNHNEMTGFDLNEKSKELGARFYFIFLYDDADHPMIKKRMDVCKKLYQDRGLTVTEVNLFGKNRIEKILQSLLLADWTALKSAELYGSEAEQVPMVEEFKKLIEE